MTLGPSKKQWTDLSVAQRRFLVLEHGVGAAVINFVLNGAIAWVLYHRETSVPLWGMSSLAVDTLCTAFFLPLATCLIVSRIVERQVAHRRMLGLPPRDGPAASGWSGLSRVKWGVALGLGGTILWALPVVAVLTASGCSAFGLWTVVLFAAMFGACLAAVVTPVIVWRALVHTSRQEAA